MEPIIRPYQGTDAPDVIRLSLRAWAPVHASLRDAMGDEIFERLYGDDWRRQQQRDVEEALADEPTEVWVAEVNGQVVGFAAAILKIDSGMGEVYMVAVDPDSQNHGLGTQLTNVATDWIREAGMPLAIISTGGDDGHAPARRNAGGRRITCGAGHSRTVDRAAAEDWIRAYVEPVGAIEVAHERPWATVLRVPLADGFAWFKRRGPIFEEVARSVRSRLERELRSKGIVCEVQARAKDIDQFAKKVIRKRYSDYGQVGDKAGARVIARY